jgi:hypothetical protein
MPIKLIAASRRRPGLTRAEYYRYIEHYHGTIAREERFQIVSYVQNHVIDGAFGTLSDRTHQQVSDREAVVELSFANFPDLIRTLDNPGGEPSKAAQDGRFFADEPTNIILMAEEEEIPVPTPLTGFNPGLGIVENVGALKVMHYIMRDEEVFLEDYYRYWREAHAAALEESPYARAQLRRCVMNKRCRVSDNDAEARRHFGITDMPIYDLVVNLWFDTMEHAGAFRQYNEALQAYPKKFANWSRSFFLYTRAIPIIRDCA